MRRRADGSPVTEADMASERLIASELRALDPSIPYLSEESAQLPYSERRGWQRYWLVDPLDGTKEFLRRTDEFTVNIALVEEGEPVLGVIAAPAVGVLYYAAKGHGAWKKPNGQPPERLTSRLSDPAKPLRIVESRSHPSPELELFLEAYEVEARLKIGSSLKFCLLAEGTRGRVPPSRSHDGMGCRGWRLHLSSLGGRRASPEPADLQQALASERPLCAGPSARHLQPAGVAAAIRVSLLGSPTLFR